MHVNIYVYLYFVHRYLDRARIIYLELLSFYTFYARDVEMLGQKWRSECVQMGARGLAFKAIEALQSVKAQQQSDPMTEHKCTWTAKTVIIQRTSDFCSVNP